MKNPLKKILSIPYLSSYLSIAFTAGMAFAMALMYYLTGGRAGKKYERTNPIDDKTD